MINLDRLAGAIRSRRGSKPLTEVETESGVPASTLNRIEKAQSTPDLSTFSRLCDWLDMPMDYFREGSDPEAVPA